MNRDEQKLREVFERKLGDLKPSPPVETIRRGARRGRVLTALATAMVVSIAGIGGYALTRSSETDQDRVVGPGPESEDGLIAFTTQGPDDPMPWIATVPVAGGEATRLREGSDPAWSPDGTRIVFACHPGICTMNADGSEVVEITKPEAPSFDESPDWSANGTIAFSRYLGDTDEEGADIYLVPEDGGNRQQVFVDPGVGQSPSFSPDGAAIAYIGSVGEGIEAPTGGFQLFTRSVEGNEMNQLTTEGASRADWSPDGQTILFDKASALWTIRPSGGEPQKLPVVSGRGFDVGSFPSWAPDSRRFAFMCSSKGHDDNDICVGDVDSEGYEVLVATGENEASPAWQPIVHFEQTSAFADLGPGWNELAPPPAPRTDAATVWASSASGNELVMWGGYSGSGGTLHDDGLLWDSGTGEWNAMPPSPLSGRAGAAAVATGADLIFFGGYGAGNQPLNDGAIFDLEKSQWREMPPGPIAAIPLAAVWTGEEAIFWGSTLRDDKLVEGAAFDPATGTWRTLPNAPLAINEGHGVWTGEELIVFGAELDGNNRSQTDFAKGMAYSPTNDSWRLLPEVELSAQASAIAWTGSGLVAWDYDLQAALYEPSSDTWREIERVPLEFSECYPESGFVGRYVFAWFCGNAALWDEPTETWTRIDVPDRSIPGEPVVAGEVLLFAGSSHGSGDSALWAYAPPVAHDKPEQRSELEARSGRANCHDREGDLLSEGSGDQSGSGPQPPDEPKDGTDLSGYSMSRTESGLFEMNFSTMGPIPDSLGEGEMLSFVMTASAAEGGDAFGAITVTLRNDSWMVTAREGDAPGVLLDVEPQVAGETLNLILEPEHVPPLMRDSFRWHAFSEWLPDGKGSTPFNDYCPDGGFPKFEGSSS